MQDLITRARAAHRAGRYRNFTEAIRALNAQDTAAHTAQHRAFIDSLPPCEHVVPRPDCPTCP